MRAVQLIDSVCCYMAHLSMKINIGFWERNTVAGKLCMEKKIKTMDNTQYSSYVFCNMPSSEKLRYNFIISLVLFSVQPVNIVPC